MALLLAGVLVFFERDEDEESRAPISSENASRASARLLPPPLSAAIPHEPEPAGRGISSLEAIDEHCGCSERALSPAVRTEDVLAIDAAWRAGDYARASAITATLVELEDRRQVLRPLLAEWVRSAPESAARFVQARPAGAERSELLEATIRGWAERDIAAASAWLNALEPHADHDAAVVAIATNEMLAARRPEIALSWAESVGAPPLRWEAICTVAETWARQDAAAALRYIENAPPLSAAERARMATHVSQRIAVLE